MNQPNTKNPSRRMYWDRIVAECYADGSTVTRETLPCLESFRCKCKGDCPFNHHPSQS